MTGWLSALGWLLCASGVNPGAQTPKADGGWLRVRTSAGEVVTDAGQPEALAAGRRLQRFAQVLPLAAPVPPLPTTQALVVAFARAADFAAVRPGRGGRSYELDGFVLGGPARTLVAVNLASTREDRLETLDHELVHIALNGALPAQPPWLAEGLAELLGAWREEEGAVLVGLDRPDHVRLLRERGPLPLERVLAAGYTSPEFTDEGLRPLFYAQSWALVRMLLDPADAGARARLLDLLAALSRGAGAAHAFQNVYGYDLAEAQARLMRSLDAGPAPLRVSAPAAAPDPLVEPAPPGLARAAMGELLLRQDRDGEARSRLRAALDEDPGLPAAHEALAHLALRRGRWEEARAHLRAALVRQPDDPPALHRMAELLVREASARDQVLSPEGEATAVALLEKAVALAPHYGDAVDLLAHLRPEPRGQRIRMLERALAHEPGRADLAFTLAGMHMGGQDPQAAHALLLRARDAARDETQRFLAEHLLRRLGEATQGTLEARGRLLALDCQPGGALDFVVEAPAGAITGGVDLVLRGEAPRARPQPARQLRLRAPTPASVLLQDGSGDLLQRELVCGRQQGLVRVRYRPLTDPPPDGPGVNGVLLTLRFVAR